MSEVVQARAALGSASRWGDKEAIENARRALAAAKLAAYVEKVVAEAPPLTDEQRARVSAIVNGGEFQ
ncbi:hypothetical protein ACTXPX_05930 [Glutamicibacter arilaitensis]|uniref:hypothetical protein n=1 Tax=Glutamicibacter arilaitensis TaxID=256701 RepID=UPI00186673D2|nr:hypothetical protein [Glutamicibacter arilaitensis]